MLARLHILVHHLNRAYMSSQVHNTNVACCTIPGVKSDYVPKGSYKSYGGFEKVYVTGPEKPEGLTLVCVYDIFGFKPQTQQGADILAETLKAHVIMPDFFEPTGGWPLEEFPPKTAEEKGKLQAFFGSTASPKDNTTKLFKLGKQLKADGAGFLVAYGFCWGGKVATLVGMQPTTPYDAVSTIHPALVSVDDAEKLQVPYGFYFTKDEPQEECHKVVDVISKNKFADKNDHKFFEAPAFHGFAAARANLDDPENKKLFEELYARLAGWISHASGIKAQ